MSSEPNSTAPALPKKVRAKASPGTSPNMQSSATPENADLIQISIAPSDADATDEFTISTTIQPTSSSDDDTTASSSSDVPHVNGIFSGIVHHRESVVPPPPEEEDVIRRESIIPPPPEQAEDAAGLPPPAEEEMPQKVNFHFGGSALAERRPSVTILAAAETAAEIPPAQVLASPGHPLEPVSDAASISVDPSSPLPGDQPSAPEGLFSPTRPKHTPFAAESALNIFSPTRPVLTPAAKGPAPNSASPATASGRPNPPPRPVSLPYSRRQSLLSKNNLTFKACLKHQFPLIDAQVVAGQANLKRVATFLKKVCEASESHAASILKLTQTEEARGEQYRHSDHMSDHHKALVQVQASIEAIAIRDQIFAQKVLALVVKPLFTWLPQAEEKRNRLCKEEKSTASLLAEKNKEAEKIRLSGLKLWNELVALRKEREKEKPQPQEKTLKKLLKTKESARKEFAKFEGLKDSVLQRNIEWRKELLPTILNSMEQLEHERLGMVKKSMEAFAQVLRESIGTHEPQPLSILATVEQQIGLLNPIVDLNRFVENCVQTHGMPPVDPALVQDLPCHSNDLGETSDKWEQAVIMSSSSTVSPSSPALAPASPNHNRGNSGSVGSTNNSASAGVDGLASIREDDVLNGTSSSSSSSSVPVGVAVAAAADAVADDDEEDEEDETLSTVLPQTIKEDWWIATVDHPPPGTTAAASTASTSAPASASSSSSSTPAASAAAELPLLKFAADDIIRIIDRSASDWWIGTNVGELNCKPGRFPKTFVRSADDKYVEPINAQSDGQGQSQSVADILRGKVSKKKKRFQGDGFDLDLTYILPNIIAMGFPSEGLEGTYRNHMTDVQRFFNKRHPNNYKLYNLCSERFYDPAKFDGRVSRHPFDDHNPCAFDRILPIMLDIHSHIFPNGVFDPLRVAAIHCKAGKGRTGFIIACWLLYFGLFPSLQPELALRFYSIKRTKNQKGVTIPSQIRYVMYFARWLRMERGLSKYPVIPPRNPVLLQSIRLMGIPAQSKNKDIWFKLIAQDGKYSSKGRITPIRRVAEDYVFFQGSSSTSVGIASLDQDVHITFYVGGMFDTTKLFQFWFNTRFIGLMEGGESNEVVIEIDEHQSRSLILTKAELDKAAKDVNHKNYSDTFRVELVFTSA